MKKTIITLVSIIATLVATAQIQDPVKWQFRTVTVNDSIAELQFEATLDAGWHLYSQHTDPSGPLPIAFDFGTPSGYKLIGTVAEPKPHEEYDEMFDCTVRSFSGKVTFRQRIERLTNATITANGTLNYQLCNDGSCIAPEDHDFSFTIPGRTAPAVAASPMAAPAEFDTTAEQTIADTATLTVANQPTIATTPEAPNKKSQSLLLIFLIALGGGILTMFTPCVFPMIPMTVNFFMHNSDDKRKNRRQAWLFGLSIVFLFAILGAILALIFGPEVLYFIGTHWIPNLLFFIIFFIFALSFFGLFEIKMPEKWINSSDEQADKGGFLAPFFIALTTVLVSFSCTGPILGAALVGLTTSSTDRWVSLVTMLGFGIGFAAPFTLLAMFPQALKNMKSGSWLNTVKVSFAFLELAFGLKFLQMADQYCNWGLLPRDLYLALWIVIFGMLGFYLLGKLRFKGDDEVKEISTLRLFLAIADLAFVVWMIPGLWGAPLKSISGFVPQMSTQDFKLQSGSALPASTLNLSSLPANRKYADVLHTPEGYEGFFDLDEAKAYATKVGKPVFIDFTGKTCANCREMEHYVWSDDNVKALLSQHFVICSLFADENTIDLPESEWVTDEKGHVLKTLGRRNLYYQKTMFQMNAQPYYVIIDADGNILTENNYKYDRDINKFINYLNEGLNNYKKI